MREDIKKNVEVALIMRKEEKLTYPEISKRMNRPVATIIRWLAPYRNKCSVLVKNNADKGRLKMMNNYAIKRKFAYDEAMKDVSEKIKDVLLRDFINIYIGEGTKRRDTIISIVNSDPKIIYLSLDIIKKYFLKEDKKIDLQVRYYKENNNELELLDYWKKLLNDDEKIKFSTYIQPTKKAIGHNNSNKFGLVTLRVNDTYAKEKLNAYMDYIKAEWVKSFEESFNTVVDENIKEIKAKELVIDNIAG